AGARLLRDLDPAEVEAGAMAERVGEDDLQPVGGALRQPHGGAGSGAAAGARHVRGGGVPQRLRGDSPADDPGAAVADTPADPEQAVAEAAAVEGAEGYRDGPRRRHGPHRPAPP